MPTTVAVCSLFKNCARTVDYFRAVLRNQIGDLNLLFSFVEGDSTDDTYPRLASWADSDCRVQLKKRDILPVMDFQDRVRKWAELGNAAIDALQGRHYDYLLWCESDLCLPPDLIAQLVDDERDVVAPAVYLGGMFYDTWGFRDLGGHKLENEPPYHPAFPAHGLMEMSSVGSVVMFRRAVIEAGVRFRGVHDLGLLVGFCHDARALGFRVFMDTRFSVIHPTTLWQAQQYRLGRIRIEGIEETSPRARTWQAVKVELDLVESPLLGSLELTGDHPIFARIRRHIEALVPGWPYILRVELLSEESKLYTLVIRDASGEVETCPASIR